MSAPFSPWTAAVVAALAILLGTGSLTAQTVAGCPAAPSAPGVTRSSNDSVTAGDRVAPSIREDTGAADVLLFAAVEARTLRFNSQPRVSVRLCWGNGAGDTLRVIERRNLPTPVVTGVTYRDVYVATELLANLNAVCLLRELGLGIARDTTSSEVQREIQRRSGVCKRAD